MTETTLATLIPFPEPADTPAGEAAAIDRSGGILRVGTSIQIYRRHMMSHLSPKSLQVITYILEDFRDHLGQDTALKAVRQHHVVDWLNGMDVSAVTIRHRLSAVRVFFRWAQGQRLIKQDPCAGLRAPRQPRRVPRAITEADYQRLLLVLPDRRAKLIVSLMFDLGLRRAEVARLEVCDLDMHDRTVRVLGKGGHTRVLPLIPIVLDALVPYMAERGAGAGPIIRSETHPHQGISAERVGDLVALWMAQAGVKAAPHDGKSAHALRHGFSERLYGRGVELRVIQAALGHRDASTTWLYLRNQADLADLRAALDPPEDAA